MDGTLTLEAGAALLLIYWLVSSILAYRRLQYFPGPFLASFTYLYIFLNWSSGRQSASYKNLNRLYKSRLVRIGPNDLITDDPDLIRRMSSARSHYGRSSWYITTRVNPYDDSLFNMVDTKQHDQLKAKMSFGYGGKENPSLEAGIDEQLVALVDLIRRKYISSDGNLRPFDLARAAQLFTLDAITRVAYGKAFGYIKTEQDVHGYIEAAEAGAV